MCPSTISDTEILVNSHTRALKVVHAAKALKEHSRDYRGLDKKAGTKKLLLSLFEAVEEFYGKGYEEEDG
jgi:hypothetical protein|tara:strand:+ start:2609 stop:2818 length:210 start_codon:yes stop_codon:yes gene_type:complete